MYNVERQLIQTQVGAFSGHCESQVYIHTPSTLQPVFPGDLLARAVPPPPGLRVHARQPLPLPRHHHHPPQIQRLHFHSQVIFLWNI